MCGIFLALLKDKKYKKLLRNDLFKYFNNTQHRGPDSSIFKEIQSNIFIGFHRLAIMGQDGWSDQPFMYDNGENIIYTFCNGEIYNYKNLAQIYKLELKTNSDCELIHLMYLKYGLDGIKKISNELNSEHAFIIVNIKKKTNDYIIISHSDRYGIRPLFVAEDSYGIYFSSELNGIPRIDEENIIVGRFPPRYFSVIKKEKEIIQKIQYCQYYDINKCEILIDSLILVKQLVNKTLREEVINRIESDRPIGCLLSGGLDSSLVAAIVSEELGKRGKKLRTFTIGLKDSEDEQYAEAVAKHINSNHTHITLTEEDFLNSVEDIVKITGSFDITTIRATTGQYLISKWISENTDIKVILCGDGSDEVTNGYLYSHEAPNSEELHKDAIRLLTDIHLYDGLRADRACSFWGIEARFPFLSYKFVDLYLSIDPTFRAPHTGIEKWLLRESFNYDNIIPNKVLWRKKEAFSDGVSSKKKSWKDMIIEKINKLYTEDEYTERIKKYKHCPPVSKESLYYREKFCEYYGNNETFSKTIPYFWLPKWCGYITDPSARVLKVYKE